MKAKRTGILVALAAFLLFQSEVKAAFLSIDPTGSYDAVANGMVIDYDVYFNVESGESFSWAGWDLNFWFDNTELTNWSASNLAAGAISLPAADTLNFLYMDLLGTTDFTTEGANLLATISFDIIAPAQIWDGLFDFEVLSQIGTGGDHGFLDANTFEVIEYAGATGADVGVVPIPGAIWLFGSGLVALIGIRRRRG